MRVLVTRPAPSAERTGEKLRARGHEAVLMPLSCAIHDEKTTRTALSANGGALAITSAEAVRAMKTLGADLKAHLTRPLYAVGRATAEEAVAAGFTNVMHSETDGAGLADFVASTSDALQATPLIYLAGYPRAAGFESRLSALQISVATFECYRMEAMQPPREDLQRHLHEQPVDAILFYSRYQAELFFGMDFVRENIDLLKDMRLVCLSTTIAAIIPQALHATAEVAAAPDEESLLQCLGVAA